MFPNGITAIDSIKFFGLDLGKTLGASGVYPLEAGDPPRSVTLQPWILTQIQSALDYVQNPDTLLFQITSWIGDTIVQYGLVPFTNPEGATSM